MDKLFLTVAIIGVLSVQLVLLIMAISLLDIRRTFLRIQSALEDLVESQIKKDMDNAEPECARCGAECVDPACQEAVRNR